jgi:hypothetical protein
MINRSLYERIMMAYTDLSIEPEYQLSIFAEPQNTADNASMYLEYARRLLEIAEWETAYYHGHAIHEELVRNPGETYFATGKSLDLSKHETLFAVRVFKLFRDRPQAIAKLHGLPIRTLVIMHARTFESTLAALQHDFPLAPLPELDF